MNGGCSKSAGLSSEHHCEVIGDAPTACPPHVPIAAHCIQPGRHFPARNTWKRAKGVGRKEAIKQRKHSVFKASVRRLEKNKSTLLAPRAAVLAKVSKNNKNSTGLSFFLNNIRGLLRKSPEQCENDNGEHFCACRQGGSCHRPWHRLQEVPLEQCRKEPCPPPIPLPSSTATSVFLFLAALQRVMNVADLPSDKWHAISCLFRDHISSL